MMLKEKIEQNDLFQSVLSGHPEAFTNEHLHTLGKFYLELYGESEGCWASLFHTNQNLAKFLKHYNMDLSCEHKWQHLAQIYGHLPNNNGELAEAIRFLFVSAFKGERIQTHFSPVVHARGRFRRFVMEIDTLQVSYALKQMAAQHFQNTNTVKIKKAAL